MVKAKKEKKGIRKLIQHDEAFSQIPNLGPSDTIAEGDSRIIYDFFPVDSIDDSGKPLKDTIFSQLYNEIKWQTMSSSFGPPVQRLVCTQGQFNDDGSIPVYRHPVNELPLMLHFSPCVSQIRNRAEELVAHELNHVLIQMYRSQSDFISEHSDKTLDIVRGTGIVNVSFGAERIMRLQPKRNLPAEREMGGDADEQDGKKKTPKALRRIMEKLKSFEAQEPEQVVAQHVCMPHNSMFVLGLESNKRWTHQIVPDRRDAELRSEAEKDYGGVRISLTFRFIGTFIDAAGQHIWGQGATSKRESEKRIVIRDSKAQGKLLNLFGKENRDPEFDWEGMYGMGSDVVHLGRDEPVLLLGASKLENKIVGNFLTEFRPGKTIKIQDSVVPLLNGNAEDELSPILYRDNDQYHSEIEGATIIIKYLCWELKKEELDILNIQHTLTIVNRILGLKTTKYSPEEQVMKATYLKKCLGELENNIVFHAGAYISGNNLTPADCAAGLVVHTHLRPEMEEARLTFPRLLAYHAMLLRKRPGWFKDLE